MKIQFNSNLQYQLDAINSIVNIFKGQEKCDSTFSVYSPEFLDKNLNKQQNLSFNETGYSNHLRLSKEKILENVQEIQLGNGLKLSSSKEIDPNSLEFTVEMETGTGKTYVYLRTIMELYHKYGFSKHIIVVPSISIKEGVFKSLQITKEHLKELYGNVLYNFFIYDSSKLNGVRSFCFNNGLEIMVINIDAFSKSFQDPSKADKANIIHRYNDSLGYTPLDLIKNTNPIIFIDEPQTTMSTPLRKTAVKNLNPLTLIRYSATHREEINLMYKLNAVDAYERKLVKQIELASVQTEGANNEAYIKLLEVILTNGLPKAKIEIDIWKKGHIKRKQVTIKKNHDLKKLTNRKEYEGYIIKDIYGAKGNEYIDFTSKDGHIKLGQSIGSGVDELQMKTLMISKTIEAHLDKEMVLNSQRIKVLSLFFIDAVANYRSYDEDGNQINGDYATIFEEEYAKLIRKPKYQTLFNKLDDHELDASLVHNGYFSIDKKSKKNNKDKFEYFKDTNGSTKADEDTYSLIMRDKEKLLSFDSKLRFIFSHSALKEGWDNPNVFQICTLRDIGGSSITPRQQIGRGLRLCVNQEGKRVYGHEVNILSVIAAESYKDFVDELQKEMEKETGIKFGIIEENTFSKVSLKMENEKITYLGQEKSSELYKHLIDKKYINENGKIQNLLRIHLRENSVDIPEIFSKEPYIFNQIISILKNVAGKLEVKNEEDRIKVKVNTEILYSPEFMELWEKVKYKTTFSVEFNSDSLIEKCIDSIDKELRIQKNKTHVNIGPVEIKKEGVQFDGASVRTETHSLNDEVNKLPDIVTYIQNETQLTRKSIVKILKGSNKLEDFKKNPQKFMEGCITIINEEMKSKIIDGITYQKIGENKVYCQKRFENEELFGYLNNNLRESKKSPHEYVKYDSEIESNFSNDCEQSNNVKVYAKLPNWFTIDTPLGTYNPDWVISITKDEEEKLYFVVETKGNTSNFDLRGREKKKIDCGKKHFEALDSGIELRTASKLDELL